MSLTGYYRNFIPLFSNATKPLCTLLKKDTKFQWSPHCQAHFEHLKKHFARTDNELYKSPKQNHDLSHPQSSQNHGWAFPS